ncbi:hypothetical protein F3Y22_tig00116951pilonHSYRG00093 [Hibiscus syriacus]|uniref:beta-galactosidase n=1 Tax=Hibiscus syriacus TaxID=106335 RepID=A0A6A2WMD2_HIBSY|nr:hypothetical protein F3Y22_tig00116951pilonHSYRG00093 [Hibiscus syriacus]
MCIQRLGQEFLFPIDSLTRIKFYQIENEYGNVEGSYGQKGKEYVKWAANMALGLGAGVPWVMCKQNDAPGDIVRLIPDQIPLTNQRFGLKIGMDGALWRRRRKFCQAPMKDVKNDMHPKTRNILYRLRLRKVFSGVFVMEMLQKVEPYVTYGYGGNFSFFQVALFLFTGICSKNAAIDLDLLRRFLFSNAVNFSGTGMAGASCGVFPIAASAFSGA